MLGKGIKMFNDIVDANDFIYSTEDLASSIKNVVRKIFEYIKKALAKFVSKILNLFMNSKNILKAYKLQAENYPEDTIPIDESRTKTPVPRYNSLVNTLNFSKAIVDNGTYNLIKIDRNFIYGRKDEPETLDCPELKNDSIMEQEGFNIKKNFIKIIDLTLDLVWLDRSIQNDLNNQRVNKEVEFFKRVGVVDAETYPRLQKWAQHFTNELNELLVLCNNAVSAVFNICRSLQFKQPK